MTITIGSNISSLKAQRQLGTSTVALNRVFERLSSGKRINNASDDAAGLTIADALRADGRVAGVGIRNASDGLSYISIADGAMAEIGNVLNRLAELAQQSANGVYSSTQRSALQNEFASLSSEIERIAATTVFNNVILLSSGATTNLQVGFDGTSTSQLTITNVRATLQALNLAASGSSVQVYSLTDATGASDANAQSAARAALDAVNRAIGSLSSTRGNLGAAESRLRTSISNLSITRENYVAAESRIRDTDVASDAAELTRLNILQQAGSSILAQANQQPQIALSLLRG
jgi:flagellin